MGRDGIVTACPIPEYLGQLWDRGTEIPSLSRDKGTTGQAQNLAKGQNGQTAKIRDGTGRDSQNLGRNAGQNGTEQKRMF